ncbi:hypothetical protein [Bradyrhizobium sp. ERR14]|uniref:hypothetical protein n=1 Tax=Bradyrhizobium sp. ERR14 TaxID=2663837 RepID=UPI00161F0D54|nr:hypothetical protein [Bradyrhizobium sp. ERR14]MBB4391230.1 hypothetical protein [Bradyrhizobium sp. ERR14]
MTAAASGVFAHCKRNLAGDFELRRDLPEMIGLFGELCRRLGPDETILTQDETILRFWRITRETAHGYQLHNDERRTAGHEFGDKTMRALSFILAFGFVIAGSSFAGAPDGNLPGVGTFQYSGSPITPTTSQSIVVAARF